MTRREIAVTALAALLLADLAAPLAASACKCPAPPPARIAWANSSAVFVGYVMDIMTTGAETEKLDEYEHLVVLKVRKRWKGEALEVERIITRRQTPACGYPFQKGMVYIVFASGAAHDRRTDRCSNTAPYTARLERELDEISGGKR